MNHLSVLRLLFCAAFVLVAQNVVWAQLVVPTELATLPVGLDRASGLEFIDSNSIWVHNDNGDPNIYEIDRQGNLLRTITISNAAAIDFEDMTRDAAGNMYIGDFGNKLNNRQDLVIYKIPPPDQISGNTVVAEEIEFLMPDQNQFPPPKADQNFDIESMIHTNNKIYLFTKDRSLAGGVTKLYSLSDQAGQHFADPLGDFKTFSAVNGAALSPDGSTLILLAENHFWAFYNFTGTDFFGGGHVRIDMPLTFKKGVVFATNNEIHIVDSREENPTQGKLYALEIQGIANSVDEISTSVPVFLAPNPASEIVQLSAPNNRGTYQLEILDLTGKLLESRSGSGTVQESLSVSDWAPGIYFYRLTGQSISTGKLVVR